MYNNAWLNSWHVWSRPRTYTLIKVCKLLAMTIVITLYNLQCFWSLHNKARLLRSLWSGGLFYTYTTTKTSRWSCRCFHLVLALESLMPGPPQWHIHSPGRDDNNPLKQKSKRHQTFWWLVSRFIGSYDKGQRFSVKLCKSSWCVWNENAFVDWFR